MTDTDIATDTTGFVRETETALSHGLIGTSAWTPYLGGENHIQIDALISTTKLGRVKMDLVVSIPLVAKKKSRLVVEDVPLVKAKDAKPSEFYQTVYLYGHEDEFKRSPTVEPKIYLNRHSVFAQGHDMFQMSELMFVRPSGEVKVHLDVWVNDSWAMSKLHRFGKNWEDDLTFNININPWDEITSETHDTHTWGDHYDEVGIRETPAFTSSLTQYQHGPLGVVSTLYLDVISYVPETNIIHMFGLIEGVDDMNSDDENDTIAKTIILDDVGAFSGFRLADLPQEETWEEISACEVCKYRGPEGGIICSDCQDQQTEEEPHPHFVQDGQDGWHRPHGCSDCGIWQARAHTGRPSIGDHCLDCTWDKGTPDPTNWVPRNSLHVSERNYLEMQQEAPQEPSDVKRAVGRFANEHEVGLECWVTFNSVPDEVGNQPVDVYDVIRVLADGRTSHSVEAWGYFSEAESITVWDGDEEETLDVSQQNDRCNCEVCRQLRVCSKLGMAPTSTSFPQDHEEAPQEPSEPSDDSDAMLCQQGWESSRGA